MWGVFPEYIHYTLSATQLWKMRKQTIKQSFSGASFVQRTEFFQSLSRKKTELDQRVSLQAA